MRRYLLVSFFLLGCAERADVRLSQVEREQCIRPWADGEIMGGTPGEDCADYGKLRRFKGSIFWSVNGDSIGENKTFEPNASSPREDRHEQPIAYLAFDETKLQVKPPAPGCTIRINAEFEGRQSVRFYPDFPRAPYIRVERFIQYGNGEVVTSPHEHHLWNMCPEKK